MLCLWIKITKRTGPVTVKFEVYNGTLPSLIATTYSWTKVSQSVVHYSNIMTNKNSQLFMPHLFFQVVHQISSIIYLDQPVGTGFSYSRTHLASKPSDSGEVKLVHEFLQKVLKKKEDLIGHLLKHLLFVRIHTFTSPFILCGCCWLCSG